MPRGLFWIALITLLLLLTPSATAQPRPDVTIESHPPTTPVRPVKDVVVVPVEAFVSCVGTEPATPTKVTFTVNAPSGANAFLTPPSVTRTVPPSECAPGAGKPFRTNVTLDFAQRTPAFTRQRFHVNVSVDKGQNLKYGPYPAFFEVEIGFLAQFSLQNLDTSLNAYRREAHGWIQVVNEGNGPLRIKNTVLNQSVAFPKIDLGGETDLQLGSSTYHSISITTPRALGVYNFTAEINGTYAGGRPGVHDWQSRILAFTVENKETGGVFSPGPAVGMWTLMLLGFMAWSRRRGPQ